jgi:hypothetical protein
MAGPSTVEPGASATPVLIGAVDHPTDPTAVVLRIESGGGFIGPNVQLLGLPPFTLYGDDSVVYRPATDTTDTGYPPLMTATLSPDQVDALLTFALEDGHLRQAHESYPRPMPDAGSTTFSIDAGGVTKRVTVTGLGMDPTGGPDSSDLAAFEKLATRLFDFEQEVAAGQVLSSAPYVPTAYRAILVPAADATNASAWPWTDLTIDDFSTGPDGLLRLGALTAEQAALVTSVPSGGVVGVTVTAADGTTYSLSLRPLLPGDVF